MLLTALCSVDILLLVIIRDYIKSGRYKTVITTPVMIVCELLCDVH